LYFSFLGVPFTLTIALAHSKEQNRMYFCWSKTRTRKGHKGSELLFEEYIRIYIKRFIYNIITHCTYWAIRICPAGKAQTAQNLFVATRVEY